MDTHKFKNLIEKYEDDFYLINIAQKINEIPLWKANFDDRTFNVLTVYYNQTKYCFVEISGDKEVRITFVDNGTKKLLTIHSENFVAQKIVASSKKRRFAKL